MPTKAPAKSPRQSTRADSLEIEESGEFVLPLDLLSITPSRSGSRARPISEEHYTDDDYDAMFGTNFHFVPGGLFVPDEQLPNEKLLPPSEFIGATALAEIAETFQLNGDPNFAARRVCTFDDLKIATTDRRLITLPPNNVQIDYLNHILPDWKESFQSKTPLTLRGLRQFILKPRKLGFSTLILALFFLDTISTPNTQTVVIAHDAETTKKLFDIMRRFYRNLPEEKRPRTGYYSRHEIWFPELDSYIYVGTAGSGQYGRGGTVQNLMGSEAGFWPRPEEIVAGLFESVPLDGNIFVESTANGQGGWFERTYTKSRDGETQFEAHFFPWNIASQYRQDAPENFTPNEEEESLAKHYNLSYDQLYWRRLKRATLGNLFEQEFPITDIEAFVTSGTPYFNRIEINKLYETMKRNKALFAPLTPKENGLNKGAYPELWRESVRYHKNGLPHLCVWEPPVPGAMYVIGCDVAEGEEVTDDNDKYDYDVGCVLRVDTMEEVAQLRGKWGASKADYAILLSQLGYWYNEALLAVERNNHGLAVLNTLQNGRAGYEQWIYPPRKPGGGGLYYAENLDEAQNFAARVRKARRDANSIVKKAGWHTNKKTKPLMLDFLAAGLNDELIGLNSIVTVQELMTFVRKGVSTSGGDGTSHDDTTIALAIAYFLAQTIDRYLEGGAQDTADMGYGHTALGGGRAAAGIESLFGNSGGVDSLY